MVGGFIRRMRSVSLQDKNMAPQWERDAPSGWARSRTGPRGATKVVHRFYEKYQHSKESYN